MELVPDPNRAAIRRVDLLPNDSAYVLYNVLSERECGDIIRHAEQLGFDGSGHVGEFRRTDRLAVFSTALAEQLFERVRGFVAPVHVGNQRPKGVPDEVLQGIWVPYALNDKLRVCRYTQGGYFFPHHDYGKAVSNHDLSLKTFMVYLNDTFMGGATSFYEEVQQHYVLPDPANVIAELRPAPGCALVFNSRITHDGGALKGGLKYLLRSEVMFRKQA